MFDIGEEVICIDDSPTNLAGGCDLVKGQKYIIEWEGMFEMPGHPEMLCVHVAGVRRDIPDHIIAGLKSIRDYGIQIGADVDDFTKAIDTMKDAPFRATRFAKIQKKKTDISSLESLLIPTEKVLEDA